MSQQNINYKDQCPDCHKCVKPEDQVLACEMVSHQLSENGKDCMLI